MKSIRSFHTQTSWCRSVYKQTSILGDSLHQTASLTHFKNEQSVYFRRHTCWKKVFFNQNSFSRKTQKKSNNRVPRSKLIIGVIKDYQFFLTIIYNILKAIFTCFKPILSQGLFEKTLLYIVNHICNFRLT